MTRTYNRDQSGLTGILGNRRGTTPAVKEAPQTFGSDDEGIQQDLNSPVPKIPNDVKNTNLLPAP